MDALKISKAVIIVLDIAVGLFIVSIAYSALNIGFEIPKSFNIVSRRDLLIVSFPFNITNGGFYNINNFDVEVEVKNSTGYLLANNHTFANLISAGTKYHGGIYLAFNVTELYRKNAYYLFFHDDILQLRAKLGCRYAMSTVGFQLESTQPFQWTAPIRNLSISMDTRNPKISYPGQIILSVPCTISYEGWLNVNDIKVRTALVNATGNSIASEEVALPTISPGTTKFDFNVTIPSQLAAYYLTHDDVFDIRVDLVLYNFVVRKTAVYNWGAPLYNLDVSGITPQLMNVTHSKLTIPFKGVNHSPSSFPTTVKISVYNMTGGGMLVGTGQTTLQILSNQDFHGQASATIRNPTTTGQTFKIRIEFISAFTYALEKTYVT